MASKNCIKCGNSDNKSHRWYSGPICRSCYYKSYHVGRRDIHLSQMKITRDNNKERLSMQKKEWSRVNRDHLRKYKAEYKMKRYKEDINFRLLQIVRRQVNRLLNGATKKSKSLTYIGCSCDELKLYLESKFQTGMTWDNYGKWHIDHIKPLSSFDLTDSNQRTIAGHYSNLQPLWASDNLKKGDKYGEI